jgi:hypothetical protein
MRPTARIDEYLDIAPSAADEPGITKPADASRAVSASYVF